MHSKSCYIVIKNKLTNAGKYVSEYKRAMMRKIILFLMLFLVNYMIMAQKKELTADEKQVIIYKGTERPFTGKYYDFKAKGTYVWQTMREPALPFGG